MRSIQVKFLKKKYAVAIKTGGHLMQCQLIIKFIGRILYWSLYAGGLSFQVAVRTGLTVLENCKYYSGPCCSKHCLLNKLVKRSTP